MYLDFVKATGLGNSFLFLDDRETQLQNFFELSTSLCDPCYGIGADGIFFLQPSSTDTLDFKVKIFNSDGSEADMCGNGIRCLHRYVFHKEISKKSILKIGTNRGPIFTKLLSIDPFSVEVDMGPPIFADKWITPVHHDNLLHMEIEGRIFGYISMGNPHCITEVSHFSWDYTSTGKKIENKKDLFPQGTNVEFVKVLSPQEIELRVWERGCKETQSCGTGACASVVLLTKLGKLLPNEQIIVHLLGGDLQIRWDMNTDSVFMRGGCTLVCEGTVLL